MEVTMAETLFKTSDLISILKKVAADLPTHVEELRSLDALLGDGDLGVTVNLMSKAIGDYLASPEAEDMGKLLVGLGMRINKANPSTFGTLITMGFMGAGKAIMGKQEVNIDDLISMGKNAVAGIQKMGKAEVGEKTLLDALVPAVTTFELEIKKGTAYEAALKASVASAKQGMEATTSMKAKHGRASWHQDQSLGVQDAGATVIYYFIDSFTRHLASLNNN
jgi:dihydroxyacetone kinase-like protein